MKIFTFIFLIIIFPIQLIEFEKFINLIPNDWSYKKDNNLLILTKKDSVDVRYCCLNPMRYERIIRRPYVITIETFKRLSNWEIKRRKFLQDSILREYEIRYDSTRNMDNYELLENFKYYKNNIDTLRIPFYTDKSSSYFIKNNLPHCLCIINDTVNTKIKDFEKTLYNIK